MASGEETVLTVPENSRDSTVAIAVKENTDDSEDEEVESPLLIGRFTDGSINIDLNNRETRLTLWSIVYIIFCVAEFTQNIIMTKQNSMDGVIIAYRIWATSDFFLLIASIILFIECNSIYILQDITSNDVNIHKILKIITCFSFIFGGALRWIALAKYNDALCNDNWCNSWHFAIDFMATYFSFCIAFDSVDLIDKIPFDNMRIIRMIIYSLLMELYIIIVISHYDHSITSCNENDTFSFCKFEFFGSFVVFFVLLAIIIILFLKSLKKYDELLSNDKIKKYVHFSIAVILYIGAGLTYFSITLLYQRLLAIVAMLMIANDLMWLL